MENFCSVADSEKDERQAAGCKEAFANRMPDKDPPPRLLKELRTRSEKRPVRKWASDKYRRFTDEGPQMANKHVKRWMFDVIS